MTLAIGVPDAGIVEKVELLVGYVESDSTKACGILCASRSVTVIRVVVLPAAVVEERKEPDDGPIGSCAGRKEEAVALDSPPVGRAMERVNRCMTLAGDELP
jgi:hypothetical protein